MKTSTEPHRAIEPGAKNTPEAGEREKFETFRWALLTQTPVAVFTGLLVLANVVVFGVMVARGVSPISPTPAVLIEWGANFAPRTLAGEPWRLLTCMFLHAGLLHLGMNMFALWSLGRFIERMFGNFGFLLLYLLSGLAGSLASVSTNPVAVSAGASGAIFGVAGSMLGGCWKLRKTMPREFLVSARMLGINVLVLFVVFTIVNHFQPMIDNTAHLAGFLTGVVCGVLLAEPIPNPGRSRRGLRNLIVALVGSAGCLLAFESLPAAPVDVQELLTRYRTDETRVLREFETLEGRFRAGAITEEKYIEELESRVLAPWRDLRKRFENAGKIPPAHRDMIQKFSRIIELREAGWEKKIEALKEDDPQKLRKADQHLAESFEMVDELNQNLRRDR